MQSKSWNYLFYFLFALKSLETLYIFKISDALFYHLPFPKMMLHWGWEKTAENLDGFFQIGLFDFIYFIPVGIFGNDIAAQLLGQFIHFFFGIGLASIIAWKFFSKSSPFLGAMAGIYFLTFTIGSDFFLYAKNDGPMALLVAFIGLVSAKKIKISKSRERELLLIGALCGIAIFVKLTALFFLVPIAIVLLVLEYKRFHYLLGSAAIAILFASPLLIRNYIYLEAPLYPALLSKFPGNLTPGMINHFSSYEQEVTFSKVLDQLQLFFLSQNFNLLLLPAIILGWKKISRPILFISVVGFSIYVLNNGGKVAPRYIFPMYFFNGYLIFTWLKEVNLESIRFSKWIPLALTVLMVSDSKIDHTTKRVVESIKDHLSLSKEERIAKYIPRSRVWEVIKSPEKKEIRVLTDQLSQNFYADYGVVVDQWEFSRRAEFLGDCRVEDLNRLFEYDYVILKRNKPDNTCYDFIEKQFEFLGNYEARVYKVIQ